MSLWSTIFFIGILNLPNMRLISRRLRMIRRLLIAFGVLLAKVLVFLKMQVSPLVLLLLVLAVLLAPPLVKLLSLFSIRLVLLTMALALFIPINFYRYG